MRLFPIVSTPKDLGAVRRDEAALMPGVRAICARHGLAGEVLARFAGGSLPVYAVGSARVLKLYPPCYPAEFATESDTLARLAGRLPVPTPEVEATGEIEGWAYVMMGRLAGDLLVDAWPEIPRTDRARLSEALGGCLAALHAVDVEGASAPRPDWDGFVREQRARCVENQRGRGLGEAWLEQIPSFLDSVDLSLSGAPARGALLHTEVMREHVLVVRGERGYALSGLFDFEPAMVGAPEYEFASVGVFVSCGDREILRSILRGYGHRDGEIESGLQRRFMAYALLHRYSNLEWYLRRVPPGEGDRTLDDLAMRWWGV